MNLLASLLFLLLSTFAAPTASIASDNAHLAGHHTAPQLSVDDASDAGSDHPFALPGCADSCVILAESSGDGVDDSALLRIAHGLPVAAIGSASTPAGYLFSFLRGRTSAPRAPPAQV